MEWKWKEKTWVEHNFPFIVRAPHDIVSEKTFDGFLVLRREIWRWLELEVGKVHDFKDGWAWDRRENEMVLGFVKSEDAVLFKMTWVIGNDTNT